MKKIGLLSDTHSFLHPRIFHHFKDCDEIWHAGDFGNIEVADKLANFKPLRAVYGNIDGAEIRSSYPKHLNFEVEGLKVFMIHIGGYPKRYPVRIETKLKQYQPGLFICGHSHILKAIHDHEHGLLHLNPGACGKVGFHQVLSLMRFNVHQSKISDLEIIELEKRV